ncbi:cation efflux protein [Haematococcus lacustris]
MSLPAHHAALGIEITSTAAPHPGRSPETEDSERQGLLETIGASPPPDSVSLSSYLVNISSAGFTRRRRHVSSFYEQQNSIIESFLETEGLHSGSYEGDAVDEEEERRTQRALNLSFASNIALLAIRVGVAVISGSLSLLVTTLDAVLDVISGAIIWGTDRSSKQKNKYKYPIGKARMAPLGVVVFSTIMGTAGMSIIMEGVNQLSKGEAKEEHPVPIGYIIGSSLLVIVMKGLMYALCRASKNSSVQAFAMDHLNDVVVNSAGLGGALLGRYVAWWLDPAAAILMSLWLIYAWSRQAYDHLVSLVGTSAPPHVLQKMTYVALNHAPTIIKQIDTVRAYSFGADSWLVEVDVVLPPDMLLQAAHDVGEALQVKLERLPEVARAFVHLDFEGHHSPGIEHKEL